MWACTGLISQALAVTYGVGSWFAHRPDHRPHVFHLQLFREPRPDQEFSRLPSYDIDEARWNAMVAMRPQPEDLCNLCGEDMHYIIRALLMHGPSMVEDFDTQQIEESLGDATDRQSELIFWDMPTMPVVCRSGSAEPKVQVDLSACVLCESSFPCCMGRYFWTILQLFMQWRPRHRWRQRWRHRLFIQ